MFWRVVAESRGEAPTLLTGEHLRAENGPICVCLVGSMRAEPFDKIKKSLSTRPDKLKHIGPFAEVVIYETRQAKEALK